MPLFQDETSVGANATVDNIMSGSIFESAPYNSLLEFATVASATGLQVTIITGSDVLLEESPPSIQNRFPIYPEDFSVNDVVVGGEHITVRVRNTTGAALTLFTSVRITPLV